MICLYVWLIGIGLLWLVLLCVNIRNWLMMCDIELMFCMMLLCSCVLFIIFVCRCICVSGVCRLCVMLVSIIV